MKKFCVLFLLLGLSFFLLGAQNADEILSVKIKGLNGTLKRGEVNPISLEVEIKVPYHINSDSPIDDFVVPTSLSFEEDKGLKYSAPVFPDAEIKTFSFSESPLPIYEGTILIELDVTIPSSFQEDEVVLSGVLNYQACDDNSCLAPTDLAISQVFKVVGDKSEVSGVSQEKKTRQKKLRQPGTKTLHKRGQFAQTVGERGLFLTFLLIFLGGLALNLTPCVYPIIPITIGYFGGQAQGRKGGILAHAIMYVLGMAVTYSALGVIASLTGSLFGSAMQNPFVLIGIALVLIALALSMFDLYEFRLPSFLTSMAGGSKKGLLGTLFMGLTVGFVAAPCIGPFVLGLLTYVGERGDVFLGFLMFFVLALGLGLPFLFLALFSGSINKLPKSGAWMVWVRTIFGFILVAMAVYFLGPLFPDVLFYNLALSLILLIGGIYMAWIEPTKLAGKIFPLIRNIIGIIFFTAALIFAVNGIKSYVDKNMESALMSGGVAAQADRIDWAVFTEELLEKAAEESKPVFIDFYADWCIPCHEMDKTTFVDSRIVEVSREFIMLKMNLTKKSNPFVKKIEKKYAVKGVPTYVFLKPDGTEIRGLRTVGYIKAERLLEMMSDAAAQSRSE
ncbi:protein-disulfide reductase DsbD family protein [Acidobacteriota bacterium]